MSTTRLTLLVLRTTQIEVLAEFYRWLGIEFTKHQHNTGPEHFAAELSGLIFELYPTQKPELVNRATRLGFLVPELDAVLQNLRSNRVEIIEEPVETEFGTRAVVRDPDGRLVELSADTPATH